EPHYVGFEMYEGVLLLAQALRSANSTKPEAIRDALKKVRWGSILGEIQFDDHHQAHNRALIMEIRKGRLEVVELPGT
ncbi:MAG: ABC transporter substrate-binding protein, partial [Thermodesulfobacteriota bacterium]